MLTKAKKYRITNALIAKWFKYSSENSFNASSAHDRMLAGIESIIQHIEQQLIVQLES